MWQLLLASHIITFSGTLEYTDTIPVMNDWASPVYQNNSLSPWLATKHSIAFCFPFSVSTIVKHVCRKVTAKIDCSETCSYIYQLRL
jgi:hypothetical protein